MSRERYYKALLSGMCVDCYIRPALGTLTCCSKCRNRRNLNAAEKSKSQRERAKLEGKCSRCHTPMDDEDKMFSECCNCRSSLTKYIPTRRKYATD